MMNIYANTGAKMAADLQVFSSDSLFSLLPATGTTTTHQYGHCYHPIVMAAFPSPFFSFLIACHLRAWFFALDTAIVCYASICFYTNTFVRSRSAFIWYNPFRCKVSYRYVGLKGHALVSSMAFCRLKKSSFFLSTSYYKNEYFFPKTLQTLPRNTYKAP